MTLQPDLDAILSKYDFFNATFDKDGKLKNIRFDLVKYISLLRGMGFVRFFQSGEEFLLRIKDNVAEISDKRDLADAFEDHLEAFPEALQEVMEVTKAQLLDKYYRGIDSFLKPNLLSRLRPKSEIQFNEHNRDKAFFYYRNGFVQVTKKQISFHDYDQLEGCVFHSQILDRDYQPMCLDKAQEGNWGKFLYKISGDIDRYKSLLTIIGYNLHQFFDTKLKATILTDARMSEEADGRSGKGVLCKGLGQMLNRRKDDTTFVEISGKDFNPKDRFKYQELALNSKLAHIDDAQRGLDIEQFFVDIASGIKVQKKGVAPYTIQTKIIFSTNRTIKISSGSAMDRVAEFELADHYNHEYSPLDEFGEWFFRDWDEQAWMAFDNVMLLAVQEYLAMGLKTPPSINLEERKLREETSLEFVAFMEEKMKGFGSGTRINKRTWFREFKDEFPDYQNFNWFIQRKFTQWLRLYVKYTSHVDSKRTEEVRSNGEDLMTIFFKKSKNDTPF